MEAKRIVVVGATSGIGLDVARLFISRGWFVGVAGRNTQMLDALKQENPSQVYTAVIDITHSDAPERLSHLIEEMSGMDVYFHSSGIGYNNPQLDETKELDTLRTNGEGFTRMIGAAYRYFRLRKKGQIVAISSVAATRGMGSAPAYSATKRFQMHYLQSIRQLATTDSLHLAVTEIRPGFVDTPLLRDGKYPMLMESKIVAQAIVKAVIRRKRLLTFDWRYRLLVAFWRMIPVRIWEKTRV
ncbi:SDR family NAD(P)-dependent oxidoreductase [Porphyromonas gingivalis]|uniref:Oxidoreductase, short chain dehydrogenase/reductase family protein n=2 Tax=Porphyromonas gingivalis TaxID=837 RepID=A0A0E2LRT5_PORGN|nr:SDR family NAD(P)-dependent oxidoreductase [Porphyromonas gingivalis]ATS05272.1 oxidoreductase [Porphyromonas gingivalis]ATS10631.1 oxidoreductase [Porphyromonas gingivalis]ERJ67493.1 oxidoreductase, short chain dehydrogenase/reductase family protein [Porphyromonas gingivalis F0570]ERJ68748.1 oxidoreductase, short chain dehydrogenase/reductase family protein [Porphyromonas gingivalis F0568]ERJ89833.1 oxidoreductase, short chain dehydrogenase/reductase family protein [Porphyromonas gingivali